MGLDACGPKPVCKQIENGGQSIVSWAATAGMVARRWIAGDIPTSYARNTLMQGEQQIRRAAAKLAQAQAGNAAQAEAARARYRQLAATLARMDNAIGKGDRGELAGLATQLPAMKWQISRLRDQCAAPKPTPSGARAR